LADVVVVPDRGGQGEDALGDADPDPGWSVAAAVFEVELTVEGVVDGFDDLSQWCEELGPCPGGLAFVGRGVGGRRPGR
jgi:hypothetical protein